MMKHVVALDVSMGKSTMVIYDCYRQCEFEGVIEHTRSSFETLHATLQAITSQDGQAPEIVFEATGVYSKELERFFREKGYARSALFLNIIQLYLHPEDVLACSKTVIRNRLLMNTRKNLSTARAEEKAKTLLEVAHESYPAIAKDDVRCDQIREYAKRVAELKDKKERLVQQMVEKSEGRIDYHVLLSFPGIGKTTAVRLIGELGDIRRFQNHKQINAYVGIDIMRYQSGTICYRDKINKRGNNKLRKILYFMVQTMVALQKKTKNHIVEYYDKLKTQPQRKPHKVASIACVNKFLKVAFHLITHNSPYQYDTASTSS